MLAKNGKIVNESIFCNVYLHMLVNWRNVIDLVKHAVLILNADANDLLKCLAVNGRIRASSIEGMGEQHRGSGGHGGTFERWR